MKYCRSCGAETDDQVIFCPKCGARVEQEAVYVVQNRKNPGLAAVLSFFIPGLGQIYNGQIGKGIKFTIIGVTLALSIAFLVGIILYPIFWAYNIHDAYSTAKRINTGQVNM